LSSKPSPDASRTRASLPRVGFVGAGRVANALAMGLSAAGYPVSAIASRSSKSVRKLVGRLNASGNTQAIETDPQAVLGHADLVFLTVPDDALVATAHSLQASPEQSIVHCSGASDVDVLEGLSTQGALTGGFHPLYLFAGLEDDAQRLAGCSITIEAAQPLASTLREAAKALRCKAISIPAGQRTLYHAGANLAASSLLCVLDEAVGIWQQIGIAEADALEALWPLVMGTLASARQKGLPGALSGPVSRGDDRIVARHLEALDSLGSDHAAFYAALTQRAVALARRRGNADPETDQALTRIDDMANQYSRKS
jgi:predicted short-subunit dehydrogenase-like oxidoreductase (DUF2520 family)